MTTRTRRSDLPDAALIGSEMMAMADALAAHSLPGPGVTRMFATDEHRAAAELIEGWMREAGMAVRMDAAGNLVGRYEGDRLGLPALMFGSHQDTVRSGGKYDGMLGIITPIVGVRALEVAGRRLPFAIEVVAFGDEEGLRFQTTLLGSRAMAGTFDATALDRRDEDGVSLAEAMRRFGLDPTAISGAARRPEELLAFVEVHIEQGPVLEAAGAPVGIVTAIAGCTRLLIEIIGEAGHAGTVPMGRRRDALVAAAESVLAIERCCSRTEQVVGTVGKLAVEPGAINVIPGRVRFTADIRAPEDSVRKAVVGDVAAAIEATAARRQVRAQVEVAYEAGACTCTPWVMEQLRDAVAAEGIEPKMIFSGAGHDSMAMSDLTAIGMLFVRCTAGISHRPDEAITAEDAGAAARVMLRFLDGFRPARATRRRGDHRAEPKGASPSR